MSSITNFLKGIVVGIGGIAPGLSGSVLLVIFGLYQQTIYAIGNFFKDLKKNLKFLIPLIVGFAIGALIFSVIVDFLLDNAEFQTRYAFLGLIVGTIPLFYKEMKKEGYSKKYYLVIFFALLIGCLLFYGNSQLFPQIYSPNFFQSIIMGIAVAGSFIIPGVDSAAILSSLGLYDLFVDTVARFASAVSRLSYPDLLDVLTIIVPAAIGLIAGALVISFFMSLLIKKFYTFTFSVIFGLFLSIVPTVLKGDTNAFLIPNSPNQIIIALVCIISGFAFSFYLGNIKANNKRLKKLFKKGAE